MTLHQKYDRWPTVNTVLMVGSVHQKVGLEASFFMPEVGPKRRVPMSSRLFGELLHSPDQGHLVAGINADSLELTSGSMTELRRTIGRRGCEDIVGVVMQADLWDAELVSQSEKLWQMPVALVEYGSDFRAIMPGVTLANG